jgi:hypothetical protein
MEDTMQYETEDEAECVDAMLLKKTNFSSVLK